MFGNFALPLVMFRFDRLVHFDGNDDSKDPNPKDPEPKDQKDPKDPKDPDPQDPKKKKVEFNQEQQDELNRRAAIIRNEGIEKGKALAKAEFEAEQKRIQDEAEKETLKKKGEFETIAKNEETKRIEAEKKADEARKELQNLKLQGTFTKSAKELGYSFKNEQAETDAFAALDMSIVGEDGAGMKKAIEKLYGDRSYYFEDGEEEAEGKTDGKDKGRKPKKEVLDAERKKALAQRYPALTKVR